LVPSRCPFLVVMMMTPLAALEPYMLADDASFKIWMEAISNVDISFMDLVLGMPSMIYNGLLLPSVPIPLIRTVADPSGDPFVVTNAPGTRPCNVFITLPVG